MEKKYQIFISSTYKDLIEARSKVRDAILSMMHFPVGMEMFNAADEEQWEIIQETIDSSDYYVLILGQRYGSVIESGSDAGISYTEKEFRYAREKKIPILVFIIDDDVAIKPEFIEKDPESIKKLADFKTEAKKGRTVQWWTNIDELAREVSESLHQQMNRKKRPGWIRGDAFDIEASHAEILSLNKKIRELEQENAELKSQIVKRVPELMAAVVLDQQDDEEVDGKGLKTHGKLLIDSSDNVIKIQLYHNDGECYKTMSHGAVSYVKSAIHAIAKTKKKLHENPDAILYIVGFYEKNLPLEWILINSGEKKRKTIYEARNGRLVKAYKEKGNLYKKLMDSVLKRADVIFAQGLEYVDFIKKTYGKKAVYTPNYVLNRSLKPYIADRPFDTIRLIYFGRVSESKNVDVVIKVAYELEKAGYKTSTTVIGGYTEAYKAKLEQTIKEYRLDNDKVQIIGQQPFDKICDALQKVHFFVFPSQEKMEGHSNSLTEAMTFGVVPVVSTAGFNASIVGNKELVVDSIDPMKYARVIESVIEKNVWSEYSLAVYRRIKENYTEDIVKKNILCAVDELEDGENE